MALELNFKSDHGFTANFWIITNYGYIRKSSTLYDLKVIIECFIDRNAFETGKTPLSRLARHFDVDTENKTLAEMYALIKEPIMVADSMERVREEDINQEPKEQTYTDSNYFKDAIDVIEEE